MTIDERETYLEVAMGELSEYLDDGYLRNDDGKAIWQIVAPIVRKNEIYLVVDSITTENVVYVMPFSEWREYA